MYDDISEKEEGTIKDIILIRLDISLSISEIIIYDK